MEQANHQPDKKTEEKPNAKPDVKPEEKLGVLSEIAYMLNEEKIVWAVGASLLLYFKGGTDHFHDIVMVDETDVDRAEEALLKVGTLGLSNPDSRFKTRHFLEFSVRGVDIDLIAGFVIVKDGMEYDCTFTQAQIAEYIQVNGETIPLQSLRDWRRYYEWMGRNSKVDMIDQMESGRNTG